MICPSCGGEGFVIVDEVVQVGLDYDYAGVQYQCDKCHGTGTVPEQTYTCPRCGYKQTFDEAYLDSGRYCVQCSAELNIPLTYWRR